MIEKTEVEDLMCSFGKEKGTISITNISKKGSSSMAIGVNNMWVMDVIFDKITKVITDSVYMLPVTSVYEIENEFLDAIKTI